MVIDKTQHVCDDKENYSHIDLDPSNQTHQLDQTSRLALKQAQVNDRSVFIKQKNRPEHHRPTEKKDFKGESRKISDPLLPRSPIAYSEIPVNSAQTPYDANTTLVSGSEQFFGSMGSTRGVFQSVNKFTTDYSKRKNYIDLTEGSSPFHSEKLSSVNTAKSHEELKALLEGVIEDQDDLPKSRSLRSIKNNGIDDLTEKIENLDVDEKIAVTSDNEDYQEDDGTVDGIKVKLLPHQVNGLKWMIGRELGTGKKGARVPKGGILADDMGLGKTLQSISLILMNVKPKDSRAIVKRKLSSDVEKCTLVVAPLALIRQWEFEIKDKVCSSLGLKVCVHHGPQRTKRFEDLKNYDVVITTYQILVSEFGASSEENGIRIGCFGLNWFRVILDEAHSIKNRNAKAARACYALRSEYRWCLTGTPMQNNLDELQSLIRFLRIKPFDDLKEWKEQIDHPMKSGRGDLAIKRLRHYLLIFMKRRTKDILKIEGALNPGGIPSTLGNNNSVGFKITERKIEKVFVKFSSKEREFYDRLESRTGANIKKLMSGKVSYASALVMLLRLRQACNHPRLVAEQLNKDKDALSNESVSSQTKAANSDIDGMTDLLGKMGINKKKCEICQLELDPDILGDMFRCLECEKDVKEIEKSPGLQNEKKKKKKKKRKKHPTAFRDLNSSPLDSEASDRENTDEGKWLVPPSERGNLTLGKAGGIADENSEGGGEWLYSEEDDSELDQQSDSDEEESDREDGDENTISSEYEERKIHNVEMYHADLVSSSKISQLMKLLMKEVHDHKFIVFSQFTSMLDLIEPFLRKRNLIFTRYDGKMRNDLREASLERLRNDDDCRILLCSLKCGSLGLNLTAATRVVILEPFWNPFIEEQAIDRVHRLTQKTDVIVYKLTIANSVEERILTLQERKRELSQQTIEGGLNKGTSKLGMNEIMQLFRGDDNHGSETFVQNLDNFSEPKSPKLIENSDLSTAKKPVPPINGKSLEHAVYGRRW